MAFARIALGSAIMVLAAACSGASGPATTDTPAAESEIVLSNEGGSHEGHTPTAFAGTGTGLFAGDNLNPSFPEGVGVQLYLTFDLPAGLGLTKATLVSDTLHMSGSPFQELGPLIAEPVTYASFGPELFDLPADGATTECTLLSDTSIECDATEAVLGALEGGDSTAQFRIRFTTPANSDGRQDLAMFFRSDSNTNESGLFRLIITP